MNNLVYILLFSCLFDVSWCEDTALYYNKTNSMNNFTFSVENNATRYKSRSLDSVFGGDLITVIVIVVILCCCCGGGGAAAAGSGGSGGGIAIIEIISVTAS